MSDLTIDRPVDDTDYNYTHNICNCGRKITRKENQVLGVCGICNGSTAEREKARKGFDVLKPVPDYSDVL